MQPNENLWSYRQDVHDPNGIVDVTGYAVEATDGKIGSVDESTYEVGDSYVVVDTGPWIFGQKVVLPAGTITQIDPQGQRVFVSRTKEEIKNAPKYDETTFKDPAYRDELGGYYGGKR
ncbi:PRC-barrel domain containing protein [Streptosporangiaceae bacterium NEAU-GS5]|nr:PRC-barrel domain containing protein [Streptosporangiaceae bacterium NEAU-GS5]